MNATISKLDEIIEELPKLPLYTFVTFDQGIGRQGILHCPECFEKVGYYYPAGAWDALSTHFAKGCRIREARSAARRAQSHMQSLQPGPVSTVREPHFGPGGSLSNLPMSEEGP